MAANRAACEGHCEALGSPAEPGAAGYCTPAMLHLHLSNRFEILADELLARLQAERRSGALGPLQPQHVLVPSAAMRRALTLAAARTHGVCAHIEFGFLAQWLWRQVAHGVPRVAEESPFAAPLTTWRIYTAFDDEAWWRRHPRLARYLAGADAVMRHDLAGTTAALFDQYSTYRPEWLAAWDDGRSVLPPTAGAAALADEAWQADLWRRLAAELAPASLHPGEAFQQALAVPHDRPPRPLPPSAHLFGMPSMPPLYLPWLERLGTWMDLHLYVLDPCEAYWYEIVDPRRLAHLAGRQARRGATTGDESYHETGNRLLAAWGRQTQAHLDLLLDRLHQVQDHARFAPHPGHHLLAAFQNGVLALEELPAASVAPDDSSIEIHRCHSLTRELEVLHDRLLSLFAADPSLQPGDVLVVTPDLPAAAPVIEAVFSTVAPARRLPFQLTGLPRSRASQPARTLLQLLALVASRFAVSEVFGLLQQPLVARCVGLAPDELDTVQRWLLEAGVHWGLDAAQRAAAEVPTDPQAPGRHSLADGLDRLFLGYALPTGGAAPVHLPGLGPQPRLPAGTAQGSDAALLGRLHRFTQQLSRLRQATAAPLAPAAWGALTLRALDDFLDARPPAGAAGGPEADEALLAQADLQELRHEVQALVATLEAAGASALPLPLAVWRRTLEAALDDPARGGVPGGGITFSAMASLRGLPFRVVAMVGMNDGAYPTANRPPEFDLLAREPRRGDRQRRLDERNVFLDLLLAARDRVLISYTGRHVRDNAALPPSVLVAELIDALAPARAASDAPADIQRARADWLVDHPLQAFSPDAFDPTADERRRSHDTELRDALAAGLQARSATAAELARRSAAALHAAEASDADGGDAADGDEAAALSAGFVAPPFFPAPLRAPVPAELPASGQPRELHLEQLVEFLRHPCRYLLRRRLGLQLFDDEVVLDDAEPFVANRRARRALAERLLPALLAGADGTALAELARAGQELPAGPLGELECTRELARLHPYAATLRAEQAHPCLPTLPIVLTVPVHGQPWRLTGGLADLRPAGLVRGRCDELSARDVIDAWVPHLFLNAALASGHAGAGCEGITRWHALDGVLHLQPVGDAAARLATLVALFERGQHEPLHFFPRSAWVWVTQGPAKARQAWLGSGFQRGESQDAAYQIALRGQPVLGALDDEFAALADTVFAPVVAARAGAPAAAAVAGAEEDAA